MCSERILNTACDAIRFNREIKNFALLLRDEPSLVEADIGGFQPLHYAVASCNSENVRLLLEAGASTTKKGSSGTTPLLIAARLGRAWHIEPVLFATPFEKIPERHRRFLLLQACARSQDRILKYLLEAGCDPNICNSSGKPALHLASNASSRRTIQLVIDAGADVSSTDRKGRTALFAAAASDDPTFSQVLLSAGTDASARDRRGRTALFAVASRGNPAICETLLSAGAAAGVADSNGITPLHIAAAHGNFEVAKQLLSSGASVHVHGTCHRTYGADNVSGTPLHYAIFGASDENFGSLEGWTRTVRLLLEAGAPLDAVDAKGRTPLDMIVASGNEEWLQACNAVKASNAIKMVLSTNLQQRCVSGVRGS